MNSETLSLRTIINELDLLKKKCYYSMKSLKNKIFVVAFNPINKKKKHVILVMLKNTINHL